jgi:hypothetical protein
MTEAIEKNKQEFNEQAERIRSDPDLNDEAKARKISEAYEEASRRHQEFVSEQTEARENEMRSLERSIFAICYPSEAISSRDKEAVRQSYRDAAFDAFDASPEQLDRLLHRAERVGDAQLARAVYHESLERGISSVTETYWELHPEARASYSEYAATERRKRRGVGQRMISSSGIPEPREVYEHQRRVGGS